MAAPAPRRERGGHWLPLLLVALALLGSREAQASAQEVGSGGQGEAPFVGPEQRVHDLLNVPVESFDNGGSATRFTAAARAAIPLVLLVATIASPWLQARLGDLKRWNIRGAYTRQAALLLFVCVMFMLTGPTLMILNKHIMQELHFAYPLSLSGLGVLVSALCSRAVVLSGLSGVRAESLEAVAGRRWFVTALPIGACKAMTLATGNAAYLHLGLGFIQMLKAFTPAVVLGVMWGLGAPRVGRAAVGFVFVIVAGTVIEVKGELHATIVGLTLMMVSEVMEAINLVMTQRLLQELKFTVVEGFYVLAPPSAACLFGAAAFLEWPSMLREGHLDIVASNPWRFVAAATLGLAVNCVSLCLIQLTSSLFSKILNTVRGICLVLVGVLFYGEEIAPLELFGYTVALIGFAGYNYVQLFPKEGDRLEKLAGAACSCSGLDAARGSYGLVVDEDEL
mmetsp:Transcript_25482/g.71729  ORF Transcript_25482/g.71729 Transcript_25482/m.71729 type:complete len:452 (-) Transcript_25482:91-1446(-)